MHRVALHSRSQRLCLGRLLLRLAHLPGSALDFPCRTMIIVEVRLDSDPPLTDLL